MLTAAGCQARRARLWEQLTDKPDWIVIADPQHLMYFANYFQTPFVFRTTNAAAVLLLGADGSSILIADNLVGEFARLAHVDEVITPVWYRGVETAPHREMLLIQSVLEQMEQCPGTHWGVELGSVPCGVIEGLRQRRGTLKVTSVDPLIHEMKRRKDPDELVLIRESMAAGDAGHAAGMRDIKPGMTELEAWFVVQEAAMQQVKLQAVVYGDFVSGPRCEDKGGPPSNRVIQAGELVLLDFSVVVYGYRGDFANTFTCGGKPTAEQVRLYDACMDALAAGEQMIRAGVACRDLDRAVRDSFASKHLAESFTSHSGHGLGLGHPDAPYLVPESSDTLVAGDVIAIEPGQYIKGVGGMRYERNYLVTDSGYETLSHLELKIDPTA